MRSEHLADDDSSQPPDRPVYPGAGKRARRHLEAEPDPTVSEPVRDPGGSPLVEGVDTEFWTALFESAEAERPVTSDEPGARSAVVESLDPVDESPVIAWEPEPELRRPPVVDLYGDLYAEQDAQNSPAWRISNPATGSVTSAPVTAYSFDPAPGTAEYSIPEELRDAAAAAAPLPPIARDPRTDPVQQGGPGSANGLQDSDVAAFQALFGEMRQSGAEASTPPAEPAPVGDEGIDLFDPQGTDPLADPVPEVPLPAAPGRRRAARPRAIGGRDVAEEFFGEPTGSADVDHAGYPADPTDPGPGGGSGSGGTGGSGDGGGSGGGGGAGDSDSTGPGRRRARSSGTRSCLVPLLVLLVIAVGAGIGGVKGYHALSDWVSGQFNGPADYAGPGSGRVVFEVAAGDTGTQMGNKLKHDGVVKSVDAFRDAFNAEKKSNTIQVGFYDLRKQMRAADVVTILVDPANRVSNRLTVPEGLRVVDVVDLMAEKTDFKKAAIEKALKNPQALGLPAAAGGNPEGYLFPATYEIGPKDTAATVLKAMVTRWKQAADSADLDKRARKLGYTSEQMMTIASLVQAEGRGKDMAKIARVIYNRLEHPDNGITNGLLQVDAAVNYGRGETGVARLTSAQIDELDSPYNVYRVKGLPPTPINGPGDDAIEAATHPASGNWLFYVTVNLKTGETKFADTYPGFLDLKRQLDTYCTTSDAC